MTACPFGTRRTRRWIPWLSISVPTLGWLVFVLYPSPQRLLFAHSVFRRAGHPGELLRAVQLPAAFTSLSSQTWEALKVTLTYAVGVTVLQIVIGLGLALLLNRRGRLFSLYRALVFMPQIFSVTSSRRCSRSSSTRSAARRRRSYTACSAARARSSVQHLSLP